MYVLILYIFIVYCPTVFTCVANSYSSINIDVFYTLYFVFYVYTHRLITADCWFIVFFAILSCIFSGKRCFTLQCC